MKGSHEVGLGPTRTIHRRVTPAGGQTTPVRTSVDVHADNTLTADCLDAPDGSGVQLNLRVNGKLVTSYVDRAATLPPGR